MPQLELMELAAGRIHAERGAVLMDIIAGATADEKLYKKLKRSFAKTLDE